MLLPWRSSNILLFCAFLKTSVGSDLRKWKKGVKSFPVVTTTRNRNAIAMVNLVPPANRSLSEAGKKKQNVESPTRTQRQDDTTAQKPLTDDKKDSTRKTLCSALFPWTLPICSSERNVFALGEISSRSTERIRRAHRQKQQAVNVRKFRRGWRQTSCKQVLPSANVRTMFATSWSGVVEPHAVPVVLPISDGNPTVFEIRNFLMGPAYR